MLSLGFSEWRSFSVAFLVYGGIRRLYRKFFFGQREEILVFGMIN